MPKPRLPRDSVKVLIPISVTADMGVAIRRTREKRVNQLQTMMKSSEMSALQQNHAARNSTDGDTDGDDADIDKMDIDAETKPNSKMESSIQREQYSSMVDYLEAKYVKGVMVEDKVVPGKGAEDDAIMSDSEASGSCYSDDSGNFIDDSDLKRDVIQQVVASSSFGKTKLEAEARRSKNSNADRGVEGIIDDDGAYFVNVGTLDMEDGWDDRVLTDKGDGASSKRKSIKRKRPSSAPQEAKTSSKKIIASSKKPFTNPNASSKKSSINTTKASKGSTVGKKKLSDGNNSSVKSGIIEKKSEKVVVKNEVKEVSSPSSAIPKKVKDASNAKVKQAQVKVKELSQRVQVLYAKCVTAIKKVPEGLWPRKKKKLVKVTIKVPNNKKSGDTILFSNPHIAGQKLKVTIPEKVSQGDTFNVSVPMNEKDSDEKRQNKIPKDLVKALYEYSCVYDEWTQATAVYRSLRPVSESQKLGLYKVGTERLKKFDVLVGEFPEDLLNPMEIPYLRSIVRNEVKRRNRMMTLESKTESQPLDDHKLFYPDKGTLFTFVYNHEDFTSI